MTDEQTALELCNEYGPRKPGMAAAIVRALQQARESAFMAHVADQSTRNYCHTASDVSDALCREMEASNIMGSHLWWGEMCRRIGLELCCAFNAGRADALVDQKPPPGHIIDDQGVVRRVLGDLAITADGCVVNDNQVHHPIHGAMFAWKDGIGVWRAKPWLSDYKDAVLLAECYSTREAAEAAKEDER